MWSFLSGKWWEFARWVRGDAGLGSEAVKQSMHASRYRVLCVDDDRSFCEFVKRLALPLGIQLDEAYSVEGAKKAIERHPHYQAFIVDGYLPDGSGFQVIDWIRRERKLAVPIGFISRFYHDAKSFRLLKEHFDVDYVLEKPIRPVEVRQLLVRFLPKSALSRGQECFPEEILAGLKSSYRSTVVDKVERLEKLILSVQKNPSVNALQKLKMEVHKIAGSAGSYGYMAVSDLCKNLELDLNLQIEKAIEGRLDRGWLSSLDGFFSEVKRDFQIEIPVGDESLRRTNGHLPLVYLIEEDPAVLADIGRSDLDSHFDIRVENRLERAIQTLISPEFYPQLLLVKDHYRPAAMTGYELIRAFYTRGEYISHNVAILVESGLFEEQVTALKRGMTCIFGKPLSLSFLLRLLRELTLWSVPLHNKVLVIDDDEDIGQYVTEALKRVNVQVRALSDTLNVEKLLADYQPDLILLDIHLVNGDGQSILDRLRSRYGFKNCVIGILSATQASDASLIHRCYTSGVNEVLFKPIQEAKLQRVVVCALQKQMKRALVSTKDPLTGLADIHALKDYLREMNDAAETPILNTLVLFKMSSQALARPGMEKEFLIRSVQAFESLFKTYEMSAYLGNNCFALVIRGYDPSFVQLFMRTFLIGLHGSLSKLIDDEPLYLTEHLVEFSGEEDVDELISRAEKGVEATPEQPISLTRDPRSLVYLREVFIFHGSGAKEPKFMRNFFEANKFCVHSSHGLEAVVSDSSPRWPLTVLLDSLFNAGGLAVLKQLCSRSRVRIPIVHLPHIRSEEELGAFFASLNYFEDPFALILLVGGTV